MEWLETPPPQNGLFWELFREVLALDGLVNNSTKVDYISRRTVFLSGAKYLVSAHEKTHTMESHHISDSAAVS